MPLVISFQYTRGKMSFFRWKKALRRRCVSNKKCRGVLDTTHLRGTAWSMPNILLNVSTGSRPYLNSARMSSLSPVRSCVEHCQHWTTTTRMHKLTGQDVYPSYAAIPTFPVLAT